ncbi:MAG TPA: DoxX family protein [Candidatus Binatia bacterium]
MDEASYLTTIETILRIALGLRFLYSGISNVRRWPNPVRNAEIVFSFGATVFGLIAVFLMIAGGLGLILGFETRVAALMIVLFLLPTFKIQHHWLYTLPPMIEGMNRALGQEERNKFRVLAKHAIHSHETGWQNNFLMLIVALFFAVRGSPAFGFDNLLR